MKHIMRVAGVALVVSTASGCSWLWDKDDGYFRDRGSDYLKAEITDPIQLPEGVESKRLDALLPVPAHVAGVDRKKAFEAPRPHRIPSETQIEDFIVQQGSGQAGWIVAQKIPAQVWPVAQIFFEEKGFVTGQEQPHQGVFETLPQSVESLQADFVQRAGLKDNGDVRYRVRIEPGVQRNTSEIFVEVAQGEDQTWNAAKAAAVLPLLQEYLKQSQADSYSLLASRNYDAPNNVVMLDLPNGSKALRLDTSFDRAWSGVGRALQGAEIYVSDVNRAQGAYFIEPYRSVSDEKPGFFKRMFSSSDKTETELYRLKLTAIGHQVFVSLEKDSDTLAEPNLTQRVLTAIQEQLN